MKPDVLIYDTTLRDGTQAEGVSFSVADKVRIACRLDEFGVDYIEGGWPGSNPKDMAFFEEIRRCRLARAKTVAFGSTRRAGIKAAEESNVLDLLRAETPSVAVFGKSWLLHVTDVLRVDPEENLEMVGDTVSFLKQEGREVIFDAEHFFDGYEDDPEYAVRVLEAAAEAGADFLALCDTNGGTLHFRIAEITEAMGTKFSVPLGIHCHNDSGLAVAGSLSAVRAGARMVQGTMNGYGERCGNANLCSIIPSLQLKMGCECVSPDQLSQLVDVARFVDTLANLRPSHRDPYVGESAFAHKGGMHVDAVRKNPRTFEHILPEKVGNHRRILVSELSGKSNVILKAFEFGVDLEKDTPETRQILEEVKRLGSEGYEFEGAEASFKILVQKALKQHRDFFRLEGFRVSVEKRGSGGEVVSVATIKVKVKNEIEHTVAEGEGPVDALNNALRKALRPFYPSIRELKLEDYKVRVLSSEQGTASPVRVLVESSDGRDIWGTVGVSENIIEASWRALVDSVDYKLLRDLAGDKESGEKK